MTTILRIQSGANLELSITRQIGQDVMARLTAQYPSATIVMRDLHADPLPHISTAFVRTMFADIDDPALALSDELIAELFAADVIVLECPMYNFGIPSSVKAWIDHVVRAKKTFRITPTGVEGMLAGKKLFMVLGSGGIYSIDSPFKAMDFQEPYLRALLGFIGLVDIELIRVEGLNMGPDAAAAGIANAKARVAELIPAARSAVG